MKTSTGGGGGVSAGVYIYIWTAVQVPRVRSNNPLIIAQTFGGIFIYIFIFISTPLLYTHIYVYAARMYTCVSRRSDFISTRHSHTFYTVVYIVYYNKRPLVPRIY